MTPIRKTKMGNIATRINDLDLERLRDLYGILRQDYLSI